MIKYKSLFFLCKFYLIFHKNDAGDVDSVTLFQGGNEIKGKQI